jgi:hypothetical protein
MRYWLTALFAHFMLGICVLWMIQHVHKVYAHGWFAAMGLNGASTPLAVATVVGLGIVYVIQIRLALAVVGLWRDWSRGRT